MTWTKGAIVLFAILASLAPTRSPVSRPAEIILLRHAEKPADSTNPHLSPAGVQRAQQLVAFIKTDPGMTRTGLPVAIYATKTTKDDDGQRTQETVAPVAKALGLPVLTPYLGKNYAELAKAVLANPSYAGKTVLICWNHESIPQLAAALGVTPEPPKWKGHVFDQVYVITYPKGTAALTLSRYGGK